MIRLLAHITRHQQDHVTAPEEEVQKEPQVQESLKETAPSEGALESEGKEGRSFVTFITVSILIFN